MNFPPARRYVRKATPKRADIVGLHTLIKNKDHDGVTQWVTLFGPVSDWQLPAGLSSPVTRAALEDCPEIVTQLINAGFSPLGKEKELMSPISAAAKEGCFDVVRLLIEVYHVPVNSRKPGQFSTLMRFVLHRDQAAVRYLISKGADVNYSLDIDNKTSTALQIAIVLKQTGIVRCLIDNGAYTDVPSKWGSLFNIAVVKSGLDIMKVLYEAGAKSDHFSPEGDTALHLALTQFVASPRIPVLKYLLQLNLSLHFTNQDGQTPLSAGLSSASSAEEVLEWLPLMLACGSPVTFLDLEEAERGFTSDTDGRVLSLLDTYVCCVKSLQQLCCFTIRRRLGTGIQRQIDSLDLPRKVKQYILLEDILQD